MPLIMYDIVVVGAGVFGSWIAHECARAQKKVLLVDAWGPGHSRSSSGDESRIIRMLYGPDEMYTRWSLRALDRWKKLFREARQELFVPCGALLTSDPKHPYYRSTRETLSRVGVTFVEYSGADLKRWYPQLTLDRGQTGIFEPESGVLIARRAVAAVVERAVALGAEYVQAEAMAPEREGVIETSNGPVETRSVVFACGPWLGKLFPEVIGKRIRATRQEVCYFAAPAGDPSFGPDCMPAWIDFAGGVYSLPNIESRGFKLAIDRHGPPFDPDTGDRRLTPAGYKEACEVIARRFPALRGAPLAESRVCQYENTSNGDFLIDQHPEMPWVWFAGGGSGHGFKHGPSVGEYVARVMEGRTKAEPRFQLASKSTQARRSVY
jgi:monomeric sarcosine oxidase